MSRGYIEVTYTNGTNFTVTGLGYARATGADSGKITVEYTVTGLQNGDIKTVTFGGTNVAASQTDEWAVSAGETSITRTVTLNLTDATKDTTVTISTIA